MGKFVIYLDKIAKERIFNKDASNASTIAGVLKRIEKLKKEKCGSLTIFSDMVVKIIVNRNKKWAKAENRQSGFTLWELLLVLFLMGVLLTAITPHFGSEANQVRIKVNLANVQKIEGAAQLYRIDVGTYPLKVGDLVRFPMGVSGWRGPYLDEVPINPFNSAQGYQIDALGQVH